MSTFPTLAMPTAIICSFNGCTNEALFHDKCGFHRSRSKCCMPHCNNMVYARNLCVRHGGKRACQAPGCSSSVRGGAFCSKHGGHISKRFCVVQGCGKQAHARQKCVRHGGGRYCRAPGCSQHIRVAGYCKQHCQTFVQEPRVGCKTPPDNGADNPATLPLNRSASPEDNNLSAFTEDDNAIWESLLEDLALPSMLTLNSPTSTEGDGVLDDEVLRI
ncbi:Aste57867_19037 [Aphanomyces stellatus]|uniref:Aste57867_19037 protein n=1 Tax=Aphanomyces stellatus TaxID=120398 RepID=A0A485LBK7_9STRA|nr:hypothetical protein As57867_018973 [Aphanomyces stellatus]VFT95762.1 Aste57867_19037 [Aphanomyces stellatus]